MYIQPIIFATAIVPDGYFGDTLNINIGLVGTRIVGVLPSGAWYILGLPNAVDLKEAMWLIQNHPTARNLKNVVRSN